MVWIVYARFFMPFDPPGALCQNAMEVNSRQMSGITHIGPATHLVTKI